MRTRCAKRPAAHRVNEAGDQHHEHRDTDPPGGHRRVEAKLRDIRARRCSGRAASPASSHRPEPPRPQLPDEQTTIAARAVALPVHGHRHRGGKTHRRMWAGSTPMAQAPKMATSVHSRSPGATLPTPATAQQGGRLARRVARQNDAGQYPGRESSPPDTVTSDEESGPSSAAPTASAMRAAPVAPTGPRQARRSRGHS